jgi:hypothetical protein
MKGMLWAVVAREQVLALVPARYEEVYADHVTLQFRVERKAFKQWLGKTFTAPITAEAWDDDIQALRVALPEDVRALCEKAHPHVTVSARKFVSPKQSNVLLEKPANERALEAELVFTIEWRPFQ